MRVITKKFTAVTNNGYTEPNLVDRNEFDCRWKKTKSEFMKSVFLNLLFEIE